MMDKMDCIVVGAGMAGNAAAYKLATEGLNVLLVDRAKPIGSKNLSGGVLWGHDMADLFGREWYEDAPVERPVTKKGIHMLTADADLGITLDHQAWREPPYNGFNVLRARMDRWFADKVAEAGGMVVEGVTVDHIAEREGKVVGIEQGGDILEADSVIIADGANSRLTMDLGLRGKLDRERYVLGVKEIIQLDKDILQERFQLRGDLDGAAHEYILGWLGDEAKAGGFLYTNEDTVSLGVVVNLDSMWETGAYAHEIMEQFRLHPSVAPLLEGGKMLEYGAHLVPEGGLDIMPQLYGDGFLVAGDAAGFVYSNGLVIQGMNYALKSGMLAADTILEAHRRGDYSQATLASYWTRLQRSYVVQDFETFQGMDKFVWDDNVHHVLPALATSVFKRLIDQDGQPKEKVRQILREEMKAQGVGAFRLARSMLKGARTL